MSNEPSEPNAGAPTRRRWRPSLTVKIGIGLVLGIAAGLFFGDYTAGFSVVGDVFVGLLQMTVLPYVGIAIALNIARISKGGGRRMVLYGITFAVILWLLAALAVVGAALALPTLETASFFSTSLVTEPAPIDFVGLYVPSNPFASLARGTVPAVVLFSIVLGVALMGVPGREPVLGIMDVILKALSRANGFVVQLTPIGLFAIAATVAGTMTVAELERLQAYLIVYTGAAVILALWVLPMLVAACTPFRYGDVLRMSRDAWITAFATGSTFVVLPMLIEGARKLFESYDLGGDEAQAELEVLVPLAYPFPMVGKILALVFIPFAAWFIGQPLQPIDYPPMLFVGVLSFFGGATIAVPFMLEFMHIPSDMFQLFIASGVYAGRIGDTVDSMHLFVFAVVVACGVLGRLRVRPVRVLALLLVALVLLVTVSVASRAYLSRALRDAYRLDEVLENMPPLFETTSEAVVLDEAAPNPVPLRGGLTSLQRIRERGVVRIGFLSQQLPLAFINGRGDLTGLDVEMAHLLAKDLGASIEFVPVELNRLAEQLDADCCDVVMSGIGGTSSRALEMRLAPYLELAVALVVPDDQARSFRSLQAIRELGPVRFAVAGEPALAREFAGRLQQQMDVELIQVDSPRDFLEGRIDADALLQSAEKGSAWTLLYPAFKVVMPVEPAPKVPLVYALPRESDDLHAFLDLWITQRKLDGRLDRLYDYWILGQGADEPERRRWCVIRDVLGWVD